MVVGRSLQLQQSEIKGLSSVHCTAIDVPHVAVTDIPNSSPTNQMKSLNCTTHPYSITTYPALSGALGPYFRVMAGLHPGQVTSLGSHP